MYFESYAPRCNKTRGKHVRRGRETTRERGGCGEEASCDAPREPNRGKSEDRRKPRVRRKASSGGISRFLEAGCAREQRHLSRSISRARRARRFGEPDETQEGQREARAKSLSTGNQAPEGYPGGKRRRPRVSISHLARNGGARSRFSSSSPHPIDARQRRTRFAASSRSGASHTLGHPRTRAHAHGEEESVYAFDARDRTYSPPRHLAANTPKPSHRPYLHPRRSLEAESPAIFYTREHILHCDVKRSASSRKAQATPASASAVSVGRSGWWGRWLRRWDEVLVHLRLGSVAEGRRSGCSGRGSERDGDDADRETKTLR